MNRFLPLLVLLLSGCAGLSHVNQSGGHVQHGMAVEPERVHEIADEACGRYGKQAVVHEAEGGWTTPHGSSFDCVPREGERL